MSQLTAERTYLEPQLHVTDKLVSVVIVCYNQARYLSEAIESALGQSYGALEVLVVDDGSTDDTTEVTAAFPAVRYVRQNNRGLAAARNAGLQRCVGEYVAFLDADDRLLPNAIQAGMDQFARCPEAAMVFGGYRNIFEDGSPAPTDPRNYVEHDHYWHLLQSNFIGMHAAVLYRQSLLASLGGFDESLSACEDYELYLRIAHKLPVEPHKAIVAEYRQHDCNMSKNRAFMLRQVVGVLKNEHQHTADPRDRRALRSGLAVWRDYYGSLMLEDWSRQRNLGELFTIFRLWPQGVLRRVVAAVVRRTREAAPSLRFGSLRRLTPISQAFGFDRGRPVDRYYVETFLERHAIAVAGSVLEVGDDTYSRRFGGNRITKQDVLHVVPGSPGATIIADLSCAPQVPSDSFDCIILTQTMHYIFDLQAAAATLERILKPGGVLLATLPGISKICRDQEDKSSDFWRFTESSARRLFRGHFPEDDLQVRTFGNVLTAIAFLEGLAVDDLRKKELEYNDPDYQVIISVVARKAREAR
jgi:glycosyltransferase involved in cell wall biosynthesis/SAM-dependent methyltransferase